MYFVPIDHWKLKFKVVIGSEKKNNYNSVDSIQNSNFKV